MLSARIKAIFVLLLATIVIMAVTVKNTPPVSNICRPESGCPTCQTRSVAFMASKGAHMPGHYKQSLYFPAATKGLYHHFRSKTRIKHCGVYSDTSKINTSKMSANRKRLLQDLPC